MKIRDAIVVFFDIIPDCHAVPVIAVKRPVYKFDLRHFMIQEKLQFFLHQLYAAESNPPVDGRKAVTA